jgi:hypothetical protein
VKFVEGNGIFDADGLKDRAVRLSYLLGQFKRNRTSKSILTIVTKRESGRCRQKRVRKSWKSCLRAITPC